MWGQVYGIMDAGAHIGGELALISPFLSFCFEIVQMHEND